MVIYNGKEMKSKFVRNNRIVEINSPIRDIAEAIDIIRQKIKDGEELSDFYITAYQYSDAEFAPILKGSPEWRSGNNVFDEILSEDMSEALTDEASVYHRPPEFLQYERYQFNMQTTLQFVQTQISNEEVLRELMAGFGILPTIWEEEKPASELKNLSRAGENLVRMYDGDKYRISMFNAPPPLAWIEAYRKLTPYEKAAVTDGRIHPAKAMQIARGIKEYAPDMLFRQEMVDDIITHRNVTNENMPAKEVITKYTTEFTGHLSDKIDPGHTQENVEKMLSVAEEAFKAKFHGRAPRVLVEYMVGALVRRNLFPEEFTGEIADEIAGKFNQTNVSRVAKYRNPVLLALSEKVNFANQKDNVLQAIGVNFRTFDLHELFEKGFPEWLEKHNNVKPQEVLKIYSLLPKMTERINENDSPNDVISKIELKKGYEDARRFEDKYGYKFADNEIAIRGRNIVCRQGNLTMHMLKPDDYRNFLVGYDTFCCQRWDDAGETCVYKYTTDPFAGCVVIERGDKIVAQGFVWTDELNDTFVFDNVELANDREVQQFSDLFAAYAQALPYANVHVGTGYNQGMNGWGMKVGTDRKNKIIAKMPTTLDGRTDLTHWGDGNCYSDYHAEGSSVARAIKHMGDVKLNKRAEVQVEMNPDEPTRWDELAKPDLNFMLNDWRKTPEERIDVARRFRENPSEEMQMEVIRNHPEAITSIDNPCHEAQMYIMDNYKDMVWKIKNPCQEIREYMVREDPSYINIIENPTEEMKIAAVEKDGLLLSVIDNPSEAVCMAAVAQNGYAVKNVPSDKLTPAVQMTAVEAEPKVISMIPNPSEDVVISAVTAKPEIIAMIPSASMEAQIKAVEIRPSVINMIREPYPEAISCAVHRNGLLIRNFQDRYPELREVAVRQNGFAIRCLKNPTIEEARIAIGQNPDAVSAIRDKELLAVIREEPADFDRELPQEMEIA